MENHLLMQKKLNEQPESIIKFVRHYRRAFDHYLEKDGFLGNIKDISGHMIYDIIYSMHQEGIFLSAPERGRDYVVRHILKRFGIAGVVYEDKCS